MLRPVIASLLAFVLVSNGWAQNTIDDKIRQEQQWLANPALPQAVKDVAQQRLAKLQQAQVIQGQIDATQQYLSTADELSPDDRAKVVQALQELQAQLGALFPPKKAGQDQVQGERTDPLPAVPTAPQASAQSVTPPVQQRQDLAGTPRNQQLSPDHGQGSSAGTAVSSNAPPAAKSVATPPAASNPPVVPAQAPQAVAGDAKILDKATLLAALQNSAVKSTVSADAQTLVRTKTAGQFSQFAIQLALVTVLAAMYPVDMAAVKGNTRELLQREVNVKTETARTDKQLTAPPNNSGSTSGIEKPGIPLLLGFALANGSVEQQTTGTGLTLSTSPYAIAAALNGGDTDQNYKNYAAYQRLGVAATFNVQGQTNPDPTQLSRRQLENWSAKLRLTPDRSTRSSGFQEELKKNPSIETGLGAEAPAVNRLLLLLREDPVIVAAAFTFATQQTSWVGKFLADNAGKSDADLQTAVEQQIVAHLQSDFLPAITDAKLTNSDELKQEIATLVTAQQARAAAAEQFEELATEYSQRFEASLEYINQYQQSLSPYSTVNFLINKHPSTGLVLTGNAQVDLYQKPDRALNQSTFRDIATAFSLEQRLFRSPFLINSLNEAGVTVSAVGRYEYFNEYAGVAGKKPNIGVFTLKTDIPVAAGVSIPLALSYATSPEDQVLKTSSFVQGNFGLTFDLDKLYTVLRAPQQ